MVKLKTDLLNEKLNQIVPVIQSKLSEYGVTRWYISGGYIRDVLLGVCPKDVDIFVPAADAGHVHTAAQGLNFTRPLEEYIDQEVVSVASFDLPEVGIPVEVIVLGTSIPCADVNEVMSRFDTDICKVLYTHTGDLIISPEFEREVADKTITVCRCNGASSDRLEERLERLQNKFPNYVVKDPLGFRNTAVWAVELLDY